MADSLLENPKHTFAIGLGAIVVTLLMTGGPWSIFDFGISISILGFGLYFIKVYKVVPTSKSEILLLALPFAMVTTSALIALFSLMAAFIPFLATIDIDTYEAVCGNKEKLSVLYKNQAIWQLSLFSASSIAWASFIYSLSSLRKKRKLKRMPQASLQNGEK